MTTRPDFPVKLFYRIGEVAQLVGVETHVLRYWETEFRSLRPKKSAKGQRVYSRRDLEKLLRIKELLYREGYTIAGAKRQLKEGEPSDDAGLDEAAAAHAQLRRDLSELRAQIQAELDAFDRECIDRDE
jgi:DNA-binding transcriptional MerR regulator